MSSSDVVYSRMIFLWALSHDILVGHINFLASNDPTILSHSLSSAFSLHFSLDSKHYFRKGVFITIGVALRRKGL